MTGSLKQSCRGLILLADFVQIAEIWKDGVARKLVVDADNVQMSGSLDVASTLSADTVRTNTYFAMQTYHISMPSKNGPVRRFTLFDATSIAGGHVATEVLILCGRGGALQVSCYHRSALFMSNYQPNNYPWVLTPLDDQTRGISLIISKVGQFVYLDVDSFTDARASSITVNLRGQFGNCKLSQGYVEI